MVLLAYYKVNSLFFYLKKVQDFSKLNSLDPLTYSLVVSSKRQEAAGDSHPNHFGISMFAVSDAPPVGARYSKDGLYRLPALERGVQPLLDWLSANHHDFRRLNDFSEAFSLLRWLRSNQTDLTLIEIEDQTKPIVAPDHVVINKGPCVRRH